MSYWREKRVFRAHFQSQKWLYNQMSIHPFVCSSVCPSVCSSSKPLNSLKSSSFVINPSSFIILHSSFLHFATFKLFSLFTIIGRTWTIPIQMSMISLVCCLCVQEDRSRKYCVVTQKISVNCWYNSFIFLFVLRDTINIHRNSICLKRFRRVHPFIVVTRTIR